MRFWHFTHADHVESIRSVGLAPGLGINRKVVWLFHTSCDFVESAAEIAKFHGWTAEEMVCIHLDAPASRLTQRLHTGVWRCAETILPPAIRRITRLDNTRISGR